MSKRVKFTAIFGERFDKSDLRDEIVHVSSPTPPDGVDVESQSHLQWHICLWCGAIGYSEESSRSFEIYGCRCCEQLYMVRAD